MKQTGSSATTATYIHTDHLGSTRVCTDSSGNSTGTCYYEPFGEIQPGTTCSVGVNYRFAGMQFDSETGLYYTWFRQYDPNQGRWLSVDIGASGGPLPGGFGRLVGAPEWGRIVDYRSGFPHEPQPRGDTISITSSCAARLADA